MAVSMESLTLGQVLPHSDWIEVSQDKINAFAHATDDHQWIHIDEQRCKQESPFQQTIAHGFLTATLMPACFYQMVSLDSTKFTLINYGVDSIRFINPVLAGKRIRYHASVAKIEEKGKGTLYSFDTKVEIEGEDKPAMVGTFLSLVIKN